MNSTENTGRDGQQPFSYDFPESGYFYDDLGECDDWNGKLWEEDALNRQPVADFLTNLVKDKGKKTSLVISVHGEWGSGKTFLLSRWACQLNRQSTDKTDRGHCAIYFDAWKDDFQSDPLVALIGQLSHVLKGPQPLLQEIMASVKQVAYAFVRKQIADRTGADINNIGSADWTMVDKYLCRRKSADILKEKMQGLAYQLQKETGRPLVFIIDELDRCRPTFAIKLLERVKHLLSIPGIVFVFGINKTELAKSIQSVYGNIDGEDYLRRFFHLDLILPPASPSDYCHYLLNKHHILTSISNSKILNRYSDPHEYWNKTWPDGMKEFFPYLADCAKLSLRQIESSIRLLAMALHCRDIQGKEIYTMEGYRAVILVLLKIKNFELYQDFIHEKCEIKDVVKYMISLSYDENKKAPKTSFKPQKDLIGALYSFVPHERADDCRREYETFRAVLEQHKTALPPASELIQREIGNLKYIPENIHSKELLNDLDQVMKGNVHLNERHEQSWLKISGNSSLKDIFHVLELGSV